MIEIGLSNQKRVGLDVAHLVETRLLITANSGAGKSWALRRLLERSHGHVQQVVLDMEGEFGTLREKFPEYILCGKGGDVPADPESASLLARKLLELRASAICDVYELKAHERIQFVRLFLESLIAAPKALWHPVLVVVDECHQFAPQAGQAESLGAVVDLATRGRKRGLCAVLATQRLAKLHKDATAELLNNMVGRINQDIDQKRAGDILGFAGKDDVRSLRDLEPGEFHAFGPAWRIEGKDLTGVERVKVGAIVSRHPKVGDRMGFEPAAPTEKIRKVLAELADLPAKAQAEQKTVDDLKRELGHARREITQLKSGRQEPCDHGPEIAALKGEVAALRKRNAGLEGIAMGFTKLLDDIEGEFSKSLTLRKTSITLAFKNLDVVVDQARARTAAERGVIKNVPPRSFIGRPTERIDRPPVQAAEEISKAQQKILDALCWFWTFGQTSVDKNALAALAGMTPGGGYFNNTLSSTKTAGWVDYPQKGRISLTEAGHALANIPGPTPTLAELHNSWRSILTSFQARLLDVILSAYPSDISKEDLATRASTTFGGGYFNNNVSRLHTLGAITYPVSGQVRASGLLFPEGLS